MSGSSNNKSERMIMISVHIPRWMLEKLDELVRRGKFPNRSEAIRVAIRDLLIREGVYGPPEEKPNLKSVPIVPGRDNL